MSQYAPTTVVKTRPLDYHFVTEIPEFKGLDKDHSYKASTIGVPRALNETNHTYWETTPSNLAVPTSVRWVDFILESHNSEDFIHARIEGLENYDQILELLRESSVAKREVILKDGIYLPRENRLTNIESVIS